MTDDTNAPEEPNLSESTFTPSVTEPAGPSGDVPATPMTYNLPFFRRLWFILLISSLVSILISTTVVLIGASIDDESDSGNDTTVVKFENNTSKLEDPADIQETLSQIEPSVVAITTGSLTDDSLSAEGGAGSGFVYSADGLIATNNHVIEGAGGKINVSFISGDTFSAEVVGKDVFSDLALLRIDHEDIPAADLGESDKLKVGDDVVAIGNALALDGGPSVTTGIVSALNRQVQEDEETTLIDAIQTDAAINPGNSGGPLVNSKGEVIGINTAVAAPGFAQNVGFAISIDYAKPVLESLKDGDRESGFLGIATVTVTKRVANEQDLDVDEGALVREVTASSPADDAGIEVGDVVTEIDGEGVDDALDVVGAVRAKNPGDSLEIKVNRDGEDKSFTVSLATRASG